MRKLIWLSVLMLIVGLGCSEDETTSGNLIGEGSWSNEVVNLKNEVGDLKKQLELLQSSLVGDVSLPKIELILEDEVYLRDGEVVDDDHGFSPVLIVKFDDASRVLNNSVFVYFTIEDALYGADTRVRRVWNLSNCEGLEDLVLIMFENEDCSPTNVYEFSGFTLTDLQHHKWGERIVPVTLMWQELNGSHFSYPFFIRWKGNDAYRKRIVERDAEELW